MPLWCALTCQPDDIQRGAAHVGGDVYLDNICVALDQLGDPDVLYLGSLLVEDGDEGLELCRSEGWIL